MARWLIFPVFIAEIKSIWKMLKDKDAPKRYKALLIFGMIYLFSPVDLIPAPILGFNIIDDITIWGAILYLLKEPLSKYKEDFAKKGKNRYKDKNVVEVDNFVVEDDIKEKQDDE
ncbi:MAG: hypothetical protein Q4C14_01805 [Bacillota bacterium]|nr:hypothetical protein [Bacillota bacterium]